MRFFVRRAGRSSKAALSAALAAFFIAPAASAQTATVAEGQLAGTSDGEGVSVFWGVPFAAPPVGDLRWAPPQAPEAWGDTIRPADRMAASCPQELTPDGFMAWTPEYMTPSGPGVAEDCLFANVWTPLALDGGTAPTAGLPVLVYIHGGAYTSGSGTVPIYNGASIARRGVVVVTINYRLGALGFMAHPELSAEQAGASGNYAIQDQIEALRWVQRNIAAFGGNPAQVTIAGQSAGGGSVLAILASPQAKGLFRAAIVQSAPGMGNYPALETAEAAGAALVESWGASSIEQARALPLAQLKAPPGVGRFAPVADGRTIPAGASQALANDVPVMTGYTLNDLFAPTRKVTDAEWRAEAQARYGAQAARFLQFYPGGSDAQASDSATREANARMQMAPIADWLAVRGIDSPVYAYLFSHVEPGPDAGRYGAFHSSELPYMFDTLHLSPGRDFTDVDRRVAMQFSGAVENFVRTGSPGGGAVPEWPALTADGKTVMEFGGTAHLSRIYPEGADAVIAAGQPPAAPAMFAPPPES